mmetsp:Transcript_5730/g.12096  ORF Transcript_5730/g.12096 Transcript_5730/m.12096 type:complete len:182 (-) Transcript_5730:80-625(-)
MTFEERNISNELFRLGNQFRQERNRGLLKKSNYGQNQARLQALRSKRLKQPTIQPNFKFGCHGPYAYATISAKGTSLQSIFSAWKRQNSKQLLQDDFVYTGIGVAKDGAAINVVQVFCTAKFLPKVGLKRNQALEKTIRQNIIRQQTEVRSGIGLPRFAMTEPLDKLAERVALQVARAGNF